MTEFDSIRATATALRDLAWRVKESAFFEGGTVDVAAERAWSRGALIARLRLLVNFHSSSEQLVFSQLPSISADDILPSHSLSDRAAVVPPPRSRAHASTFREIGGESFRACVERTFASIDAIRATLRNHELAVAEEGTDIEAIDLLHPIIVTDAAIRTLGERLAQKTSVRLLQSAIVGGEHRWIDVVHANAIGAFIAAITKHYEARHRKFAK
ncbi:MAG TPA: hypothetical protein VMU84_19325 [Thermoanaerobaculia bacterium]|nr:hypothetical protein [Thermoanaerobaculia bacterium]